MTDRIRQLPVHPFPAADENMATWPHLKERGEFENTIFVYSSDHGEMLGDHGLMYKTNPYPP